MCVKATRARRGIGVGKSMGVGQGVGTTSMQGHGAGPRHQLLYRRMKRWGSAVQGKKSADCKGILQMFSMYIDFWLTMYRELLS